ncbi:MAG TPA: flagellar protein FliT [Janthinobacterium sp.]|jgi:flagellar protein FliT|nr:flagellar protein FliT [Janthinobacterium sp.]
MMTNQEILSIYEEMSELTGQMLAAAGKSDWDQLTLLEKRCAAHIMTLKQNEQPPQALEESSRQKKMQLIKKLLNDDRQIRDLTTPWMTHLSALINNTGNRSRLALAYRSI